MAGRIAEGTTTLRRALALIDGAKTVDHEAVYVMIILSQTLAESGGDDGEALALQRRAVSLAKALSPTPDRSQMIAEISLAEMLAVVGKLDEAVEAARRSYDIARDVLDPAGSDYATIELVLAQMLRRTGALGEARDLLRHAAKIVAAQRGPIDPTVRTQLQSEIGECELALGDIPRAREALEAALSFADANSLDPLLEGEIRFALARALVARPASAKDRARAVRLALAARSDIERSEKRASRARATEVKAWLAARR
jgi:tetratricopeptide (TPR) repeat protein